MPLTIIASSKCLAKCVIKVLFLITGPTANHISLLSHYKTYFLSCTCFPVAGVYESVEQLARLQLTVHLYLIILHTNK